MFVFLITYNILIKKAEFLANKIILAVCILDSNKETAYFTVEGTIGGKNTI